MATCTTCKSYFRHSPYNAGPECDNCVDQLPVDFADFDEEAQIEVEHLLHPTGKTQARFLDD